MADGPARAALDFASGIAAFFAASLGARLLGVYALGSLAHGGFSQRYSDIDVALVSEDGLGPSEIDAMRAHAVSLDVAHAAKLSLFWTDRSFAIGRMPPLDRVDYLDHAAPLVERERVRPERPSRDAIRSYLSGQPFESWESETHFFAGFPALPRELHKRYVRALLYPARLIYSWETGAMASNDDAVAFLKQHAPAGLDVDFVERALAIRIAGEDPDALFPERARLLRQFEACVPVVRP